MSEDSITTLMWVVVALMLAWVPVATIAGKRSGASLTILVEALIISCIIAFEAFRRSRKC
jgi:hypothetical protein